jgi:hypothetical protein
LRAPAGDEAGQQVCNEPHRLLEGCGGLRSYKCAAARYCPQTGCRGHQRNQRCLPTKVAARRYQTYSSLSHVTRRSASNIAMPTCLSRSSTVIALVVLLLLPVNTDAALRRVGGIRIVVGLWYGYGDLPIEIVIESSKAGATARTRLRHRLLWKVAREDLAHVGASAARQIDRAQFLVLDAMALRVLNRGELAQRKDIAACSTPYVITRKAGTREITKVIDPGVQDDLGLGDAVAGLLDQSFVDQVIDTLLAASRMRAGRRAVQKKRK